MFIQRTGFIFVQQFLWFLFGKLLFIHTLTNATDDHKYSPLPSAYFDSSKVLVSFSVKMSLLTLRELFKRLRAPSQSQKGHFPSKMNAINDTKTLELA